MKPGYLFTYNKTTGLVRSQNHLTAQDSLAERWAFRFLVGLIASQGFLIPVIAFTSLNWSVWPNLPDFFGVGLVLSVVFMRNRPQVSSFDRDTLKDIVRMGAFFALNVLIVTSLISSSGEGIKFGVYNLFLFGKLIAIYWAIAHVPLDRAKMYILHIAALAAFLWLSFSTLGDRYSLIEINDLVKHLPQAQAGKWSVLLVDLESTVSNSHGVTTVTQLILGTLVIATAYHYRDTMFIEGLVFLLTFPVSFITGSRQGIVRAGVFFLTLWTRRVGRLFVTLLFLALLLSLVQLGAHDPFHADTNPYIQAAAERHGVLIEDPFSNESLAGRPELWAKVINTLNSNPIFWFSGYGMGNYVEYQNAAHNMLLKLLQDGGIIEIVVIGGLWLRIFRRIWSHRQKSWSIIALTAAMLTSTLTAAIFYPALSTGWYLGLYFIVLHITLGNQALDDISPETDAR